MNLTKEQHKIIQSKGNIKINAVAGSGKTTTVIEYAKARPRNCKILYLAFNKPVKLEAKKKFLDTGLHNVQIETAHSLAYKHIVFHKGYKVKALGYKTHEIVEVLALKGDEEKHTEYILANHIKKFATYFCNSDKEKVQQLNYLDTISDSKAKKFVKTFYNYIEKQTRIFLSKMDKGEIEVTHDFYLKKFQLSAPKLHFDYILFDEGQDASPAMLDIFLKQKATKVIVGDTHQQIYGWRFAVNSLEKTNFKTFHLSTSFRFGQDIANLGMEVLQLKKLIGEAPQVTIKGRGQKSDTKSMAVIARTNLGLLLKAIKYISEYDEIKSIYFEGNINSYAYAEDGTSLYDVLNLYNHKRHLIKDKLIKKMRSLDELSEYIEKTEDRQLATMVEIVKEYGNEIPDIIKSLKEKHVKDGEKVNAMFIFSTVHRCKGMEYDEIQIVNDFLKKETLEKILAENKPEEINYSKLNEEINLLYVAVTRAKKCIYIPYELMPENFPDSPDINITGLPLEDEEYSQDGNTPDEDQAKTQKKEAKTKAYSVEEVRQQHGEAYRPWSQELDDELTMMFCEGIKVKVLAQYFGRTQGAIRSRIKKLELDELYG